MKRLGQSSRLPMLKLTVVPVIPLALSDAMRTAMFAVSASVESIPRGHRSARSATNAVPDMGGVGCIDHPDDIQLDT